MCCFVYQNFPNGIIFLANNYGFFFQYMVIMSCVFFIQLCVTIVCLTAVNREGLSQLVRTGLFTQLLFFCLRYKKVNS